MLEARREEASRAQKAAVAGAGASAVASTSSTATPSASSRGPRVIIAGPVDSGKSTLVKCLVAYACRMGWVPLVADCDLGQGELSVPGTIAASPVDRLCLSVVEGLTNLTPLTYFFGDVSPGTDPNLFKHIVQLLAAAVGKHCAASPQANASGCIINTMGWVEDMGYSLLLDTIHAFEADIILVIGQVGRTDAVTERVHPPVAKVAMCLPHPVAPLGVLAGQVGCRPNKGPDCVQRLGVVHAHWASEAGPEAAPLRRRRVALCCRASQLAEGANQGVLLRPAGRSPISATLHSPEVFRRDYRAAEWHHGAVDVLVRVVCHVCSVCYVLCVMRGCLSTWMCRLFFVLPFRVSAPALSSSLYCGPYSRSYSCSCCCCSGSCCWCCYCSAGFCCCY
jgi:hypothetical protein